MKTVAAVVLAALALLALAGCCASPCVEPAVPAVQPAPAYPCPPGTAYRGVGWDGKPACQACGAGKCG